MTVTVSSPSSSTTTSPTRTRFDRDIAADPVAELTGVLPAGAARYRVELSDAWLSATGVHGGYQVAMAVNAAQQHSPDRSVRTIATSFFRPGQPGEATLTVRPVRTGRSLTTLLVDERQDGRLLSTTRLTLTADVTGPVWQSPAARPDVLPFEACDPIAPPPGILHFDHATAWLDPRDMPFGDGPLARVAGWVQPLEPRPIDAPWLAMIMDWFPPSPFSRGNPPVGAVSVDYTVHLHGTTELGDGERLAGEFAADVSVDGLALERGRLATADGRLLAESFHTRWTGQG